MWITVNILVKDRSLYPLPILSTRTHCGLNLHKSCTSCFRLCQFICAWVLFYQQDTTILSFISSGYFNFLPLLFHIASWVLKEGYDECIPLRTECFRFSHSAHCPIRSLCISSHLLQEGKLWWWLKEAVICEYGWMLRVILLISFFEIVTSLCRFKGKMIINYGVILSRTGFSYVRGTPVGPVRDIKPGFLNLFLFFKL